MKSILVPVNLTSASLPSCKYAISLARDIGASITYIYVLEDPVFLSGMGINLLMEEAESRMHRFFNKLNAANPDVVMNYRILKGAVATSICNYASTHQTDLIIIGNTKQGRIAKSIAGNPVLQILRNAPCPAMEIPKTAHYKGLYKIVYATDLSKENLRHLETLIPFAKVNQSEIIVLYVNLLLKKNESESLQSIINKMKKKTGYASITGFICDDIEVTDGLAYFLQKKHADCIAIYTQHHSALYQLFKESTVKKATTHIHIPVLVIHDADKTFIAEKSSKVRSMAL